MATAASPAQRRLSFSERMHVQRSRGAINGVLLVILGVWGGLIPFIGPRFGYAFTPDISWHYTTGRLWLEILPAAATVLGGLLLLATANRPTALFGGWLAAVGGLWFVVGPELSRLWNNGTPVAGAPASNKVTLSTLETIGYFSGLGAVIIFLAAVAIGRTSVVAVKDVDRLAAAPTTDGYEGDRYDETSADGGSEAGEPTDTEDTRYLSDEER